jgi:hypothetical protein
MADKRSAGRPKGALNKGNEKLRKALANFVERNYAVLGDAMEEVRATSPKDYVNLFLKICEFSLPKLQSINQNIELGEETINKINVEIKRNSDGDTSPSK